MSHADIIVIGGGIAGVSAAAELAAEADVLLFEAEPQIGYHSTGRSAATFILNYGNATLRALNAVAEPLLTNPEGVSDTSLLSPRGELILAGPDDLEALKDYAAGATGLDRLSPAEVVEMVPILRPDRIAGALYERSAQDIDVDRMLQGYARLLRTRGGTIKTNERITAITREGNSWQVDTTSGQYTAPVIINASGAWADGTATLAGAAPVGLQPMRRTAALIPAPVGYDCDQWPLLGPVSEAWYAKPDAGRLLVSPADEAPVEAHDAFVDDMVLAEGLHRFEQDVTITVTRVEHSWAGLRSFTPDRTPVAGFDPNANGFYWLAGQGGYGVQTAPALARLVAAQVLGQQPVLEQSTIKALSPSRFS